MDDRDDDLIFQQNSQSDFIEYYNEFESKENSDNSEGTKSRKHSYDEMNDMSQSLLLPHNNLYKRKRLQEINDQDVQEEDRKENNKNSEMKQDKDKQNNQDLFNKHNKDYDKINSNNEIPVTQKSNSEVRCIHCTFDKELDKRNYYFGNLLIGELQYLPPCMRSEAYINILNYVEKLKHKHKQEPLD